MLSYIELSIKYQTQLQYKHPVYYQTFHMWSKYSLSITHMVYGIVCEYQNTFTVWINAPDMLTFVSWNSRINWSHFPLLAFEMVTTLQEY